MPMPRSWTEHLTKSPSTTLLEIANDKKELYQYTNRNQKRLYRKLLSVIPLTNIISPRSLWDTKTTHKITKSNWIPQKVTQLLQDIPSDQVIQSTLKTKKPNKNA